MRDDRAVATLDCGTLSKVKGVIIFLITHIVSAHDGFTVASEVRGYPVE
jgi:hypothetical protein